MGAINLIQHEGEASEIGSVPHDQESSVMWIARASPADDTLIYRREVGPALVRCVAYSVRIAGERHDFWRREVHIHRDKLQAQVGALPLFRSRTQPDYLECVVATQPYSVAWATHAPFKRPSHKVDEYRTLENCQSRAELFEYLATLPHDYWANGRYIVAGFDTWLDEPTRKTPHDSWFVLGMCCNFEACRGALSTSQRVRELLRATEEDTILYQAQGVPRVPLAREAIETRNSHIDLAIRQALAGPYRESDEWLDRPVADKVEHIYKLHLNNHNRRLHAEPRQVALDERHS